MARKFYANRARLKRHQRMRNRLSGTSLRPRLNVFRSGQHIYAQIIDDTTGQTLVAASTLEAALRSLTPEPVAYEVAEKKEAAEAVTEAAPAKGKGAKAPAAKAPAKGAAAKGSGRPGQQVKTVLPQAQRSDRKTPLEALAPIANNHKVAMAREVGKLVAQRAQEKGVTRVVFDRGGYAYHGRVAALAQGARDGGLDF
jgi:ribosomal protein L18